MKVTPKYKVEEIAQEFHRVRGQCYLDHAGAALYSEEQVRQALGELAGTLLGNPHSRHTPSDTATQTLEAARHRVLEHFNTNAEDYDLIFTSGATAALRLVAEHFDWKAELAPPPDLAHSTSEDTPEHSNETQHSTQHQEEGESSAGAFVYLQENHTSVLGMRGPAHQAGCDVFCLTATEARDWLGGTPGSPNASAAGKAGNLSIPGCGNALLSCVESAVKANDLSVPQKSVAKASHMSSPGDLSTTPPESIAKAKHLPCPKDLSAVSKPNHLFISEDPTVPLESIANSSHLSIPEDLPTVRPEVLSNSNCLSSSEDPSSVCPASPRGKVKRRNCLFAYSGQCNFSGSKAPLEWIRQVQEGALDGLLATKPINKENTQRRDDSGSSEATKWYVVLDAASLVATCPLDLARWKPDFVPVSFYKMFGYPTGLGCLLVRRRAWDMLGRTYQGGGTVLVADSRTMVTVPRPTLHDRFEDGTLPFLSIPAIRQGLDTLHRLTGGMQNIASHVFHLARYTHHTLASMRHSNGTPVAVIYQSCGDTWQPDTHGSIVNFNLLNPDGTFVGYAQVERVASLYNIHLRTGCLCNPGACQALIGITSEKLLAQFKAGHVCGDAVDLVDGEPTGSVRVSFGYSSTYQDADHLLTMIRECFVEQPMTLDLTWLAEDDLVQLKEGAREEGEKGRIGEEERVERRLGEEGRMERREGEMGETERKIKMMVEEGKRREDITNNNNNITYSNTASPSLSNTSPSSSSSTLSPLPITPPQPPSTHTLTDIVVFPVKSCGGVRVSAWGLGGAGLALDRQWMVVTGAGATLTQKRLPRMALILPRLDLQRGEMVLACEGESEELLIPLDPPETQDSSGAALCGGRVCGVRVRGLDCGEAASAWLSRVLGTPDLRLMRQTSHRASKMPVGPSGPAGESLSLANESQYLVIHRPSVRSLLEEINHRGLEQLTEDELVSRFRGNLVVDGGQPFEEDSWATMTIAGTTFQVQGGCRRCQMVCVVPGSGQRTREPMLSLASARGSSMLFGVHASAPDAAEERVVSVGAAIEVTMK